MLCCRYSIWEVIPGSEREAQKHEKERKKASANMYYLAGRCLGRYLLSAQDPRGLRKCSTEVSAWGRKRGAFINWLSMVRGGATGIKFPCAFPHMSAESAKKRCCQVASV